jgi:hypothetical protein
MMAITINKKDLMASYYSKNFQAIQSRVPIREWNRRVPACIATEERYVFFSFVFLVELEIMFER